MPAWMRSPWQMGPTPAGVPVSTMSHSCSVTCFEMRSISSGMVQIISRVDPYCRRFPLTSRNRLTSATPSRDSGIASGGTMVDNGRNVSQPFANDQGRPAAFAADCQSRAVTSMPQTKPEICEAASQAATARASLPMTTPSSTAFGVGRVVSDVR